MYSHREGADQLFVNFYNNNMKGTLAQKIYTVYKVDANLELDEYFEKAISLLPQNYNKNTYDQIIQFWVILIYLIRVMEEYLKIKWQSENVTIQMFQIFKKI